MNMKNIFPEYFKDRDELEEIWENCIFVFDANVIIDLYRYSEDTKKSLMSSLRQFKGRAWITYHATEEYLRNRASVIAEQETHYTTVSRKIDDFVSDFKDVIEKNRQHPFISEKSSTEFFTAADKIKEELKESGEKYFSRVGDDEIRKEVVEIFDGQIGKPFNEDELNEIFDKGIVRYKNKVPPGYEDIKKYEGSIDDGNMTKENKKRVFGDLIIWEEIIRKSKEDKKDIILVTGDIKEDWWSKSKGKNLGPRVELIKEFEEKTEQKFYMYTAYRFLDFSSKDRNSVSVRSAIKEIKETNSKSSGLDVLLNSAALNKPFSNEELNNYFLLPEVSDLLVKNKTDNDFGLVSDEQEISYDEKLYLARKNINKLKKKISTFESEISRYKNNIQELSSIDDFVGIDDEDNERLIEMKEVLNKYLDIHKKLKLDLMRKRLELEVIYIEKRE